MYVPAAIASINACKGAGGSLGGGQLSLLSYSLGTSHNACGIFIIRSCNRVYACSYDLGWN